MPTFTNAVIIFNPNSTGDAKQRAEELQRDLAARVPDMSARLLATEHAGHAEQLAYESARRYRSVLVISASGDGGYNEVVNGALRAQEEGATPVCAVLPAGNANDHARTTQDQPLVELIADGKVKHFDVLKVVMAADGTETTRYAHSYAGLGLTPTVAVELNKHTLSSLREAWIVLRTFWKLHPVIIRYESRKVAIDSLICSIIPEMAKVLTISESVKVDDGLFELTILSHNSKVLLMLKLFRAVFSSLGTNRRVQTFECTVLQAAPIQLDGEVTKLARGTTLKIVIGTGLLCTIASD